MSSNQKELPEGWKWEKLEKLIIEKIKSKIKVKDSLTEGNFPFFTSGENVNRSNQFLVKGKNNALRS